MPGRWEPCPENRKADLPAGVSGATPRATSVIPVSPASSAARCAKVDLPVTREKPTSTGDRSVSAAMRSSWAASASSDFADTSHGTTVGAAAATGAGCEASESAVAGAPAVGSVAASAAGACSMMACALVPLMPKDDTPARHGRSASGHGVRPVSSSTAPADQSTCVEGRSTCSVLGSTPCCIDRTILMMPATPAAAWV